MAEFEAELVRRTLAGDRGAFSALVEAHLPRAKAIARTVLGDDVAVDDAVQQAFLRAYEKLGQLSDPATFPGWIATIVRNEAVTWLRQSTRLKPLERISGDSAPSASPPSSDGDEEREAAARRAVLLRQALARLTPAYREILALRYEADLDYPRIAATLGLTEANVEKRLYRARQALLAALPAELRER
jgi:RNA polymerase sigma-70 factor (ECF subfamily)